MDRVPFAALGGIQVLRISGYVLSEQPQHRLHERWELFCVVFVVCVLFSPLVPFAFPTLLSPTSTPSSAGGCTDFFVATVDPVGAYPTLTTAVSVRTLLSLELSLAS